MSTLADSCVVFVCTDKNTMLYVFKTEQRYVARPLLWRGRKFHFRCYATLSADLSSWLYRRAYILCASRPYTLGRGAKAETGLADDLVHISNLAVNKHTKGHPGQVCGLRFLKVTR